jgi:type IV secretory pathway TraG/TraD family ATPase VirD4
MLIFVSGHYPIYGKQVLYFCDPEFAKRAAERPPQTFYAIEQGKVRRQPPLERAANRISKAELLPVENSKTEETHGGSSTGDLLSFDAEPMAAMMTASRAAAPSEGFLEQLELDRKLQPPTQRKEL